ncbi:restriction endonuclease subunit S [Cohnella zeiphila]|uniref:Restriction endonuclease subunit S n=1 Tax=Cohnella zeiphila TaxID=2761120 RepID=A0A7X0SMX4_9BACL|nr:restriction endonuclease subunit S [Cohnella zeiphila]MBB6732814.1 restriction endonuclease subunit S [Cohnella zeiphila]
MKKDKWRVVKLEDILRIDKKAVTPEESRNRPYLGLEHILKNTGEIAGGRQDSSADVKSIKFAFDKRHILYGKLRPNLNKVALPDFSGVCSTDIYPLLIDESLVDRRFVGAILRSNKFVMHASSQARGVNLPRVEESVIYNFLVSLPPLNEQFKIAEILSKVTELILLQKQQITKLDLMVKSRFIEMFGDPIFNPYRLPVVKLGDITTTEPQNGLYKPLSDYVQDDTGTPILRIDAFYNGVVTDFRQLKRLRCNEIEKQRYLLCENDIVINRVNSLEYLGKCAHIRGLLEDTVFESNMMRLHVDENKFNAKYVACLLCTDYIYNQILSHAKKSVNQASINQKDVQDFDIYMPPLESQNQFAMFVAQVDKSKFEVQQGLKQLELQYNALMQQYFG